MKASVECSEQIEHLSKEKKMALISSVMKKEQEEIDSLVNLDEGILRFGGDLKLTKKEEDFKREMMKLKENFEKTGGNLKGNKGGIDMDEMEKFKIKRERMAKDLEKKMAELKSNRNTNFLIFGVMALFVLIFLLWQCFRGGSGANFQMDEDVLKASEMIKKREKDLESEVRKLKRMRKAMKKKLIELGMEKEKVEKLEISESEEEEEGSLKKRKKEE